MTSAITAQDDRTLTPGEVARMFRVDPKTVARWATAGRIKGFRTPGGHRRFKWSEIQAFLPPVDAIKRRTAPQWREA